MLLVWLYLMGNVVLLGGAVTWWSARGRAARPRRRAARRRLSRSGPPERQGVGPCALARVTTSERAAGRKGDLRVPERAPVRRSARRRSCGWGAPRSVSPLAAAPQHGPGLRARGHVDRVEVDAIAGPAEARDDHGARTQRPLGQRRRDPVVGLVRIGEQLGV